MIVMHERPPSVRQRTRFEQPEPKDCGLAWSLLDSRVLWQRAEDSSRRRFDHAVDNSGDSFGLVADWSAITRRRRSYSPAAGRCGCRSDHQPRHWTQSRLGSLNRFLTQRRKDAKEDLTAFANLCVFAPLREKS